MRVQLEEAEFLELRQSRNNVVKLLGLCQIQRNMIIIFMLSREN